MESVGPVATLRERKAAELARRQHALAVLRDGLAAYGAAQGGRFLLYGSAALGAMRHDSDVDVLVDFPEESRSAAWDFVEDVAPMLRLPVDVNYVQWCGPALLAHIAAIALP